MSGKKRVPTPAVGKVLVEEDACPHVAWLQRQASSTEPGSEWSSAPGTCGAGGWERPRRWRAGLSSSSLGKKRWIRSHRMLTNVLSQACLRNLQKKKKDGACTRQILPLQ